MATDDPADAAPPPAPSPESPSKTAGEVVAENDVGETSSEKARDLLRADRLHRRQRLGERLLQRVGGRMWDRPNLAVSARLYKRFQLDDPWAPPGTARRDRSIGLGPVSLRFGEKRRQPAPHLRPKAPKKKKAPGAVDPVAKYRRPKPTPKPQAEAPPKPTPRPAPKPAAKPAPPGPTGKYAITGSSGEFGRTEKKRGLVGKLPTRPDLADGAKPPARKPAPKPSRSPQRTGPVAPPRPASPPGRSAPAAKKRRSAPSPTPTPSKGGGGSSGGGGGVALPRPKLPTPKKRRAGRFRMSPTETRSPVVKKIVAPEPVVRTIEGAAPGPELPAKKKKPAPVEKPIDRSIPTGPMGLNDLFGAMDAGRMRVGRRKKKKVEEDSSD